MVEYPLITVYITNFNYGNYIKQAVESVLNQSFQDFELIIIDDGSTDNSKEIIESYSHLKNVSVIYQKNKGLNITNNVALKASKGEYIMRLDADDFLEPTALEVLSNKLEEDKDIGLVFPDYYIVDEYGYRLSEIKRHNFSEEVKIMDQPAHGACTMIRVNYLKSIGGYDESYKCQDGYELWVKFINKFNVTNVNKALFSYRRHNNNLTNNENRILSTRLAIKQAYVKTNGLKVPKTVGIIPLRPNYDLTFEPFGKTNFLDWKISQLIHTEKLSLVVITSSDTEVEKYIKNNYKNSKVQFIYRPKEIERINVSLFETLMYLKDHKKIKDKGYELFAFCSISTPFVDNNTIDDAINTLLIFKANSLISVRPEDSKFYSHTGNGMKAILNQDSFTKLEREAIYKYTGGIIIANAKSAVENGKLIHGEVGHIVVSEESSLNITSDFDKRMCNYLLSIFEKD